ncbi:54S ribosomal protein L39, mitochondrial [Actinomortierella wolfii]|nr:54S ribosomal protein L39, mitochondrial [Actinomortierella wolfii]
MPQVEANRTYMGEHQLAKKAKARTIIVKLLSTAGTGFFYTTRRPRTSPKLSFMKFDPRANQTVLFNEAKINRPN